MTQMQFDDRKRYIEAGRALKETMGLHGRKTKVTMTIEIQKGM